MSRNEKIYTIIESGKFKGKKLLLPSLTSTRSTKSIVKNCVFNVLRYILEDKVFIECFGGSGVMAALALSNNALKAYVIELDKDAYKIAYKNALSLNSNLEVLQGDCFELLDTLLKRQDKDIILYFDPPFHIRYGFEKIYEKLCAFLEKIDLTRVKNIIFEHSSKIEICLNIKEFHKNKVKKFGNTTLSFYEKI
ncbi:23S rRNA (adenine(2030)-N(6))-methyltransferase RlmJ [Campylobacter sp. LR185c]|uniref:RsmD family RNA methyltransferase n=1 Tax=Campylobacter sp. LR185c TaxID=2014525 RepID=UPI001237F731|nr:RsmD family RNA methyltransferase [Campylobacter sp. LR185c]KAA6227152.1 23S rRNA (adenine(2030)-N(6))-methyltransferase RlmJ [Campylobacter sp. LR185c]KAA8603786.1 16S rRNA (guanine(966)-N(2))-methyltransferase RsmD [Campylobacter sp. LR185c]